MTPSMRITLRRPWDRVEGSSAGFLPSSYTFFPKTLCKCCPGQESGKGSGTKDMQHSLRLIFRRDVGSNCLFKRLPFLSENIK
ncbi:hypothetical protein DPMN_086287 [Dreissena polymorpha]|uniref:Uncharacterized protein n=1 Tax=Dreissena polymorpha TaxID=45954 RepID=A0A9D4QUF6_DREPO|nr:hypothetical protein DPMN_086287 [Dreissena polymorpha]